MSGIDRSNPMPLWAQLLEILRARLDRGEFADAFPTDNELTEEYGLSRHTVREAVRRLQQDGIVTRERGRGTFVRRPAIEQPVGAIYSLFRSIEAQGVEQRSEVLDLSATTDIAVAGRLGLPRRSRLVRLERVRCAGADPIAHDTAWLPHDLAAPLLDVDFSRTALYDELAERCGVRLTSGTEWIRTVLPDPDERAVLKLPPRQPAFSIQRLSQSGERPVEWRETVVRGDRYTFVATWSGGDYATQLTSTPTDLA